jgi:hypothetical protein
VSGGFHEPPSKCTKGSCNVLRTPEQIREAAEKPESRRCYLEGHCNIGYEIQLGSEVATRGAFAYVVTTIRDPVMRLLSEFRHTCGGRLKTCLKWSKQYISGNPGQYSNYYVKKQEEWEKVATQQTSRRQLTREPEWICPAFQSFCRSDAGVTNNTVSSSASTPAHSLPWSNFIEYAIAHSNYFVRSRTTQMMGFNQKPGSKIYKASYSIGPLSIHSKSYITITNPFRALAA